MRGCERNYCGTGHRPGPTRSSYLRRCIGLTLEEMRCAAMKRPLSPARLESPTSHGARSRALRHSPARPRAASRPRCWCWARAGARGAAAAPSRGVVMALPEACRLARSLPPHRTQKGGHVVESARRAHERPAQRAEQPGPRQARSTRRAGGARVKQLADIGDARAKRSVAACIGASDAPQRGCIFLQGGAPAQHAQQGRLATAGMLLALGAMVSSRPRRR